MRIASPPAALVFLCEASIASGARNLTPNPFPSGKGNRITGVANRRIN